MLLRPSELARLWELHPKTVYLWIKGGRLPAVKTPGDQYRVRSEDVPAFCEANGLPVPSAVAPKRTVMVLGASATGARTLRKALKGEDAAASWYPSALEGLVAAGESPPSLLVIDASSLDVEAALRALRRIKATRDVPVLVYQVPTGARATALVRMGARWAIVKENALAETLHDAIA